MAREEIEGEAVRAHVEAAPALHEGDDRGHRERALDDLGEAIPDGDVLPVARRGAADLLCLVSPADTLDRLRAVAVRLQRRILLALARGIALRAEAPRVRLAHHAPRVVHERRAVCLLDGPLGEARRQ